MNRTLPRLGVNRRAFVPLAVLIFSACASQPTPKNAPLAEAARSTPAPALSALPAAPTPATPSSAASHAAPLRKLWGIVQSLDGKSRELIVKDKRGRLHHFSVASDVVVDKGGNDESIALSDVRPGDYLRLKVSGKIVEGIHVNVRRPR